MKGNHFICFKERKKDLKYSLWKYSVHIAKKRKVFKEKRLKDLKKMFLFGFIYYRMYAKT